jgi:hypothetical protein
MANENKPGASRPGVTGRAKSKGVTERPFDLWLQKQLHAMYDEIASEPLPAELLDLIDRDAASPGDQENEPGSKSSNGKK